MPTTAKFSTHTKKAAYTLTTCVMIACALPAHANAYIGPGTGVVFMNTFFAVATAVIISILMILAYPAWMLWNKWKRKNSVKTDEPS